MNRNEFSKIVEAMLLATAALTWLSSMIYWIQGNNNDLWFSRSSISIICLGIWYIGEKARETPSV